MAAFLHFEDFDVGSVATYGEKRVEAAEIIAFAREFDPQAIHTDPVAAAESPFGGLIASGLHSCSMMMRLMCDGYMLRSASMGSPGVDEVRYLLPVRPGDVLRVRVTVTDRRRSASRPEMGIVFARHELLNQQDDVVLEMTSKVMMGCRDAGGAA
ncbi:MaoC family dehydratase [Zavarzinia compransoris]|uniref:Acyl dehydratase n=1 Tax=Zavarzinia compransoris TaxID=1264899 RepID=A0A317E9L6_9PROT|nr:MaoC family dehydratase [Zavarzinia compransoris]PWR23808.1 acyl dehydratase [Zavarzinia compransoris]TDP48041.1 acyl dehydratase [Zavarzinia compransoris]